jgi:hypothetical protein
MKVKNTLLEGDTGTTVDGEAVILTMHFRVLDSDGTVAGDVEAVGVVTAIAVTVSCECVSVFKE